MTIRKEAPKTIDISTSSSSEVGKSDVQSTTSVERKKRAVSFNKLVFIRETLHINNYKSDEKKKVWYQKNEQALMRMERKCSIRLMIQGALLTDSDTQTSRGLEFRSREGAVKRQENRLNALAAVLDEQESQFDMGLQNDEPISLAYQRVSWKCKKEAFILAKLDSKEAHTLKSEMISKTDNFLSYVDDQGDE
jgi:hypothetical protein